MHYHVVYLIPAQHNVLFVAPRYATCNNMLYRHHVVPIMTSQHAAEASFRPASHFLAFTPRFVIVGQLQELSFLGTLWFLKTHISSTCLCITGFLRKNMPHNLKVWASIHSGYEPQRVARHWGTTAVCSVNVNTRQFLIPIPLYNISFKTPNRNRNILKAYKIQALLTAWLNTFVSVETETEKPLTQLPGIIIRSEPAESNPRHIFPKFILIFSAHPASSFIAFQDTKKLTHVLENPEGSTTLISSWVS